MRWLAFLFLVVMLVNGSPIKPAPADSSDKLESFPWIKASKAKARFGPTTAPPCTQSPQAPPQTPVPVAEVPVSGQQPQLQTQPSMTPEMLQNYIAALAAQLQLQPLMANAQPSPNDNAAPVQSSKKPLKAKSPKLKTRDAPAVEATTQAYWEAEKKLYPDSLYDDFYLDWVRKRQIEEIPVATPTSLEESEPITSVQPQQEAPAQPFQPYPTVPLAMNPYLMNPFMYPLAGLKVSKAMAQAQVNAALAALNITTTPKPVKIKLKIPIPGGSDLAQVVASGIAGFPAGTTYELSKKK